jgi:hypothetical protein
MVVSAIYGLFLHGQGGCMFIVFISLLGRIRFKNGHPGHFINTPKNGK